MALDYARFAETARRLILSAGREVTFDILDATAGDSNKPWKGPSSPPQVDATVDAPAAFVPPEGSGLGKDITDDMLLHRAEQVCLVAPTEAGFDFHKVHRVTDDDGTNWRVVNAHVLRPGSVAVLFALGLAR